MLKKSIRLLSNFFVKKKKDINNVRRRFALNQKHGIMQTLKICIIFFNILLIKWTHSLQITSSALVSKLHDLRNIKPELVKCPIDCRIYIEHSSALGYNGPIGALG